MIDWEMMRKVLDKFFDDCAKYGKSDVKCPYCGTPLECRDFGVSYEVRCQAPNCFRQGFRGI